jgi:hypothetical protein
VNEFDTDVASGTVHELGKREGDKNKRERMHKTALAGPTAKFHIGPVKQTRPNWNEAR